MSTASLNIAPNAHPPFRLFTRESLQRIQTRMVEESAKKKELEKKKSEEGRQEDEDEDEGPKPNPNLEQGMSLPIRLAAAFVPELACTPLEDIDPFYENQATFVIISKKKDIFRFSATDAVWALSPFNPIRRVAIAILTHGLFTLVIITTILTNCFVMIRPASPLIESSEVLFTAIYTAESCVKVMARGFILEKFTYLRDAWNWLDFVVICLAYLTNSGIELGNLAALRTFRVLRALKTVAIVPGLKTIVAAVIESVKNLRDVIILTIFSLSVFGLVGLQIYMGVLTQKCIKDLPRHPDWNDTEYKKQLKLHSNDSKNWQRDESLDEYVLCGNHSGFTCDPNYSCQIGYGPNPDFGYTSFDSFGSALLSAFRLMTQDYWERLYQQILKAAGPWHMLFFIFIIFLGSFYLVNLILAIVAMSYDELQKKAEEEDLANAAEMELMRAEDATMQQKAADERSRLEGSCDSPNAKTPSEYSYRSYEGWGGPELKNAVENKETNSMKSDGSLDCVNGGCGVDGSKNRKTSLSLPGSPYNARRKSRASHLNYKHVKSGSEKKTRVLSTFIDAQEHLPYVDDSTVATPMSDENGPTLVENFPYGMGSRRSSYYSHASRFSYTSHGDLTSRSFRLGVPLTKESQIRMRSKTISANPEQRIPSGDTGSYEDIHKNSLPGDTRHMQAEGDIQLKDVIVLSEIIDQAGGCGSKISSRVVTSYHFATEDEEEEEGNRIKQKIIEGCFRCIDIFCVWDWGFPWSGLQKCVSFIVFDPFAELFITLAIGINTLFMALDYHGIERNPIMKDTLKIGNKVFSTIFAVEASMKLVAMSPKYYFQVGWNVFDFIIVTLSLLEMVFEDANLPGISALRSFRLLRVFKLAKSWPTLNLLISIMGKTMGALGNLVFVLIIIIFIFAVMGMQLFSKNYIEKASTFKFQELPRWNFTDFGHSFMIIFRVLCGEWIESMWDCIHASGPICIPFFLATVIIGNLVVLNLFLALLLSSFGASNLSSPTADAETNKLAEAFNRIARFSRWIKSLVKNTFKFIYSVLACRRYGRNQIVDQVIPPLVQVQIDTTRQSKDGVYEGENVIEPVENSQLPVGSFPAEMTAQGEKGKLAQKVRLGIAFVSSLKQKVPKANGTEEQIELDCDQSGENIDDMESFSLKSYGSHTYTENRKDDIIEIPLAEIDDDEEEKHDTEKEVEEEIWEENHEEVVVEELKPVHHHHAKEEEEELPQDCCPTKFYDRFPIFQVDETPFGVRWASLRLQAFRLIENKYFETAVIIMILISSLALALEDYNLQHNPFLQDVLYYMDRIFTVVFFLEMLLKWLALGFKNYFTNAWCWLDFFIVMLSLINFVAGLLGAGKIQAFKTMRTLRALRPLRAMSRMQGMRVVVNALVQAIPSIFNVLLVCLIFWLIFAIMGVQLFSGKYYKCRNKTEGVIYPHDIPPYGLVQHMDNCTSLNLSWENSAMNFDHVGKAYVSLFQVATFKGWIQIMNDAIDSRAEHEQPVREYSFMMYLYFVIFIIFGSFFTLNLFIGVIIDNFNEQKKKAGGSLEMFMTDDQKKYYNAMKKMGSKKPMKAIPRPKWRPQAVVFEIVTNTKFDMIIMLFIGFNMLTMTMDHYDQAQIWEDVLGYLNTVFIVIFGSECGLKIFALRHHYFTEPWNLFDFVVVLFSILTLGFSNLIEQYFVSPTLLRVVRVAKVGRVLRLVKGAKGIRTLLFALAMSLPALFNICLLLFLIMFIFAIFGMSFFMNVELDHGLDIVYNFRTLGQSMILLFQMSTSAGWDGVLSGITNEDECEKPSEETGTAGTCGNAVAGIAFLISYLVISFLIVINMYIAVILENYSQATEEVQEGLTDDDYDMYYEIWAQFDPEGTTYIRYNLLTDFLDILEPPLQIHKPNKYKIITMDIPICKDDMMHCADILNALTKDFFARKGNTVDEGIEMADDAKADRPGYLMISSTLWRQREDYCARLIQMAWRKHKNVGSVPQPGPSTEIRDS